MVAPDTGDGKDSVCLAEPFRVQLIVGHDEPEHNAQNSSEYSEYQEHDLPRRNSDSMLPSADCNAVSHETTQDLTKAVEREPDACACSLLALCIPLAGEKRKSGRDGGLKDTKEEAYCHSTSEIRYRCKQC